MKKTMLSVSVAALCCGAYAADEKADPAEHWNFDELSAVPACRDCPYPESRSEGLRALLVEGRGPDGTNAEFFAYYGRPDGDVPPGGFPGVVLVHGGGGTAYPNYVKRWMSGGFAVIALDWYNQRPAPGLTNAAPRETSVPRVPLPGGRRQDHKANVANMVLSHSLLRSMPDVNKEKTVMVGLSWGSWYGTAVAAVDPRFRGVVEIYCGGLQRKKTILGLVDGRFLWAAKSPMWWFVSTNDQNVNPMESRAGWNACGNLAGKTIVNDLPHSHVGFEFEGCIRMARHFACGEPSLPKLGDAVAVDGRLSARILGEGKGVDHAKIAWTESFHPMTHKRPWRYAAAEVRDGVVSAPIPAGAVQAYLSAYEKDEGRHHELCGSSAFVDFKTNTPVAITFPHNGQKLPAVERCYVLGLTRPGVTNVVVQGKDVAVHPNGGWVTMVDLKAGENTIVAGDSSVKVTVERGAKKSAAAVTNAPAAASAKFRYKKLPYAADKPKATPKGRRPSEITVVVDAGHGGSDTGAMTPRGFTEKDLNLRLAMAVRDELRRRGYVVVMTREDDSFPALYDRPKVAHAHKADAFISIHHNAPPLDRDPRKLRYHTVYAWNDIGSKLAAAINSRMAAAFGPKLRSNGVMHANFAVTRNPEIPSCLIETDFITTPEGEVDCLDDARRMKVASAIADGFADWTIAAGALPAETKKEEGK